jgi:hypothetical protein
VPGAAIASGPDALATMTGTQDPTTDTQQPFDADVLLALLCEAGIGRAMVRGLRRPVAVPRPAPLPCLPHRPAPACVLRRPGVHAAGAGGGGPGRLAA